MAVSSARRARSASRCVRSSVARDGIALRLRVGEFRGLQPDLEPGKAVAAAAQQRAGGQPDAFAATP